MSGGGVRVDFVYIFFWGGGGGVGWKEVRVDVNEELGVFEIN